VSLRVEPARSAEARERVHRFRYRVYVEEMGIETPEADADRRILCDPLDAHAVCWALLDGDRVVGTVRAAVLSDVPDPTPLIERYEMKPAVEAFGPEAIALSGRFMLDPELRGGTAILRLMSAAFDDARERGVRLTYGDCSPHLLGLYEHLGFRRYARAFMDPDYGFKVPILLLLGDAEQLERVRSPLRRVARRWPEDDAAARWFRETHPDHPGVETASLLPEGVFLDLLCERVAGDPLHALGLLRGLTREEAERFLARATVVRAGDGDALVRQGERGEALFVLLSGGAEVRLDERPEAPIGWLGAGDFFGEMGFLTESERTASVVARGECETVVLSGDFLRGLLEREPALAAKVLLNLSREMAGRLADMNRRVAPR